MPQPNKRWVFWSQDLASQEVPPKWGGFVRHGRCTLTQYVDNDERRGHSLGAEWALLWNSSTSVYYEHGPTDDWEHSAHAAIKRLFSVWVHWSPPWKQRLKTDRLSSRQIGVSAHDGVIFWKIWKDPHSWSSSDGWKDSSWNWQNWLLGKTEYTSEVLQEIETVVPMPEANYPVTITMTLDRWTREHTMFGIGEHEAHRAHIEMTGDPVPVPGKGENAWDLDDDHVSAITCQARTVSEAIAAVVESAMRTRERHGGLAWTPT